MLDRRLKNARTQIYIKKAVTEGPVKTLSSSMLTLYLNVGQGLIAWGRQFQTHEFDAATRFRLADVSRSVSWAVPLSCLFGLGISYFGFSVRRKISATAFTVLGCVNKLLSLGFDVFWLWGTEESPSANAVFSLVVCIAGGLWYSIEVMKDGAAARRQRESKSDEISSGVRSSSDVERSLECA